MKYEDLGNLLRQQMVEPQTDQQKNQNKANAEKIQDILNTMDKGEDMAKALEIIGNNDWSGLRNIKLILAAICIENYPEYGTKSDFIRAGQVFAAAKSRNPRSFWESSVQKTYKKAAVDLPIPEITT